MNANTLTFYDPNSWRPYFIEFTDSSADMTSMVMLLPAHFSLCLHLNLVQCTEYNMFWIMLLQISQQRSWLYFLLHPKSVHTSILPSWLSFVGPVVLSTVRAKFPNEYLIIFFCDDVLSLFIKNFHFQPQSCQKRSICADCEAVVSYKCKSQSHQNALK